MGGFQGMIRAWCLFMAVLTVGCGDPVVVKNGESRHALTDTHRRILGFESPTIDWQSSAALSASTDVTQGSFALQLPANGWVEVVSAPMDSLGTPLGTASIDIRLMEAVPWGDIRLVLTSPTAGLWWGDLGAQPVSQLSSGSYHQINFAIPAAIQQALSGTYADLQVRVIFNGPATGQPVLLDNLRLAADDPPDPDPDPSTEVLSFVVPQGVPLESVIISGSNRVQIDDGVEVDDPGNLVAVASMGLTGMELGGVVQAHADLYSAGPLTFLRSQTHVDGTARAAGAIVEQEPVLVDGGTFEYVTVPQTELSWSIQWPSEEGPLQTTGPDGPVLPIAPGAYAGVQIYPRGKVQLSTGTYYFGTFVSEPESEVLVDTSLGPIFIYTHDQLIFRGPFVTTGGSPGMVLVGHVGTGTALLEAPFVGAIVAPNAAVELRRPLFSQHEGVFFGESVQVFSNAHILHKPFDFAFLDPGQSFPMTEPLEPINQVPLDGVIGDPVKDYAVCAAGLDLQTNDGGNASEVATALVHVAGATCPYAECGPDDGPPMTPTEAELNELPGPDEVCEATLPRVACGIDPDSIDYSDQGLCEDDSICLPTGRVCALICSDPNCTSTEFRCAKQKESCAGLPEEHGCRDVWECPDEDYTGDPMPRPDSVLQGRPPNNLEETPVAPPELTDIDVLDFPPVYPRPNGCDSSFGAEINLPEQFEPREAHSGNEKWGIYAEPQLDFTADADVKAIGGEAALDFGATASFDGGVYVWGRPISVLAAAASANLTTCSYDYNRFVTLFGVPVVGDPDAENGATSAACEAALAARSAMVSDVRYWWQQAVDLKQYVDQAGFTEELCVHTYGSFTSPFHFVIPGCTLGGPDCVDEAAAAAFCAGNPAAWEQAAHEWSQEYLAKVNDFIANQSGLDVAKGDIANQIPTGFELINEQSHIAIPIPIPPIPIGPVLVTIDLELAGGWGFQGDLGLDLAFSPATRVGVTGRLTPDFNLTVLVFAGVPIGPVKFGIAGELVLIDIEAPVQAGISFVQVSSPDGRPELFPGAPTAFAANKYEWRPQFQYGSRVLLSALSGRIDLQARVKLGFFKKTFRKKLADWPGIGPIPFDFVGGELPITSPVDMTFGLLGEDTEYVDPEWLDESLEQPTSPVATELPELGQECLEEPK